MTKRCSMCQDAKPLEDYHRNGRAKDGRVAACKECKKAYQKDHYRRNREHYRQLRKASYQKDKERWAIRYRELLYGLSDEDYQRMLADQDGRCAACRQPPGARALHVDHCHETGVVRGLLCGSCNRALGLLKDDPFRISALLGYIGHHAN